MSKPDLSDEPTFEQADLAIQKAMAEHPFKEPPTRYECYRMGWIAALSEQRAGPVGAMRCADCDLPNGCPEYCWCAEPGQQCHVLKTDPEVFDAVWRGVKTHEIRKNDRGFAVGDTLILRETEHTGDEMRAGKPLAYTGRALRRKVSHVLTGYGLTDGWCILSFAALAAAPQAAPGSVPEDAKGPSGREVLRNVIALCEATEDDDHAIPVNDHAQGFRRGRQFEAKRIRKGIGIWFQDECAASPSPDSAMKP